MSSDNDPVAIPMIERNPNDLPGIDTSDLKTLTGEAVLSFHNISYQETVHCGLPFCKKPCVIERLSNINGIMKPGLNAIMGPQDGSRALLLDVLAARKDPRGLSGDILINGKPRPANFTCASGYVPQNDVVMRTVTVRDNIEFSAALRLPMTMTRDEKRRRVNEVLELLCLDKMANVKPRSKELEKRTSIAMELVTEHSILFLDDPTTDLDLSTATDIISVLRRMSRRGRTIIFSINQPPYSIFRLFDSLTLVASGKVMFHGPSQESLEYFTSAGYNYDSHNNPADFFLDIINGGFSALLDTEKDGHDADEHIDLSERQHQVRENLANMYAQSSIYSEMRTELDSLLGEQKAGRSSALEEITCVTPFYHQLRWIICRSFTNFKGFPWITVIRAIISILVAVFIGTLISVVRNDCAEVYTRSVFLFLLTSVECITGMSAGELFVIDRDRFVHEHTSGYYRVSSYFLGKLLGELVPRRFLPSIIFIVIMFSIAGAGDNAAAVPTQLIAIYFMFMVFITGLSLYSISFMHDLSWLYSLSILHYGFTALLHNELMGQNFCPENKIEEINRCYNFVICTGEEFLTMRSISLSSWGFWENIVALACIMTILLSIIFVQLLVLKKKRHFKITLPFSMNYP
ncbi:ATP-binding cassette sub-family G member 3-like isoform X2 [Microtus oregoni]|uniref:ATP-binding cassette sub-family G member 3-like isoform X2 n=1 Tax=Microtus oregoni TaxID=111838 RepID=UPI001BB10E39|nr:ATP-binding cassette sub-family G member 3-like isoform X2 [Microtus oregoni]